MQPVFNINREKNDNLFYKSYSNDKCVLQFHSQIEIYLVDEGEMDMFVDGQHKTLKKEELSVALSYSAHSYKTPVSSRSSTLIIPSHICKEFFYITQNKKIVCPFFDNNVYNKIKPLYDALTKENTNYIQKIGYVYIILGIILENSAIEEKNSLAGNTLSTQILFYIEQNFKNDITALSVAKHLGYCQSYVSRYFKKCFGISLSKYINIVKLNNAIMLLKQNQYDITYCAMESGFSSMRTFYRCFSEELECTPSEYLHREEK